MIVTINIINNYYGDNDNSKIIIIFFIKFCMKNQLLFLINIY